MLAANAAIAELVRSPLPIHLTPAERDALAALAAMELEPAVHREAHKTLHSVLAPIEEAARTLRLVARTRSAIRKVILQGLREHGEGYGAWDVPTWAAVAHTAGEHAMSTMAIGCLLGAFTSEQALAVGVQPLHFARRLFGREAVEYQSNASSSTSSLLDTDRPAPTIRALSPRWPPSWFAPGTSNWKR